MNITIKEVAISRHEWIERMQLSDDIAASAIKAKVLVVPSNYVDRPLAFPVSTMDFGSNSRWFLLSSYRANRWERGWFADPICYHREDTGSHQIRQEYQSAERRLFC